MRSWQSGSANELKTCYNPFKFFFFFMPPSPSSPSAPVMASVPVQTKIPTRTVAFIMTAAIFALGLAAYGFGFFPAFNKGFVKPAALSCTDKCQAEYCYQTKQGFQCDKAKYTMCVDACNAQQAPAGSPKGNPPGYTPPGYVPPGYTPPGYMPPSSFVKMSVIPSSQPPSRILVAGNGTWYPVASYQVTNNETGDILFDRFTVGARGDSANFDAVGVAVGGRLIGQAVLPAGLDRSTDVVFASSMRMSGGSSITAQVWVRLAPVVASASTGGATVGFARSGNMFAMNMNNAAFGNTFVIRKTAPAMTSLTLPTSSLADGDVDLYRFQVSADPAGSVGMKKVSFGVTLTPVGTPLRLERFGLRRGSVEMAPADIRITDGNGNDLQAGALSAPSGGAVVVVMFRNEDVLSGSGQIYTLHAMSSGARAGDAFSIQFALDPGGTRSTPVTGYLSATELTGAAGLVGPHIDTGLTATDAISRQGTFVWSDLSEVPHVPQSGIAGGSRDWTTDTWADIVNFARVLTR